MTTIHELNNQIAVWTPLGDAKAIAWTDYGPDVNTCWKCRIDATEEVRNFFDDDILMYPNAMNGEPTIPESAKENILKKHKP